MPIVVALGGPWPRIIRGEFSTQQDALGYAKSIFARFYEPGDTPNPLACPVYVYDDPRPRPYGLVRGTRLDGVTWESWNGLQRREDARTDYQPTWREPAPAGDPPGFSEGEFAAFLATLQPQGAGGFGPVIPDGLYRLTGDAGTLTVRYDADATGDTSDPPAWGPENAPEDSADQIFEWKFRAAPNGIDPASVAWSEPTGPVAAVPPLYPGIPTRIQAFDRYEETEILDLDVQTYLDYADDVPTLEVIDPYTGYSPAPIRGPVGIPFTATGEAYIFRTLIRHLARWLPPNVTNTRFAQSIVDYQAFWFDGEYLQDNGHMGEALILVTTGDPSLSTWPTFADTEETYDHELATVGSGIPVPFGERGQSQIWADLKTSFIQYLVRLTPKADIIGGDTITGRDYFFWVAISFVALTVPTPPPPPKHSVPITVAVGAADVPVTGSGGFYGIPKAVYAGNMADGRNVYVNWLYSYAQTPAPYPNANTPDGMVCLGYLTAEPLGPVGAPPTAMQFLYWEQPILVAGPTRFYLWPYPSPPSGAVGYLVHTNYDTGLPNPPQGQQWPFYAQPINQ